MVIGDEENHPVVKLIINEVTYITTSNYVEAFDELFKVFFALNAEYPAESIHAWSFIQQFVYGIVSSRDMTYNSVTSLQCDIEQLQELDL